MDARLKWFIEGGLSLAKFRSRPAGLLLYLSLRMYEADALLIDGYEQKLRIVGVRRLLHLEEGGAKSGPPVDDLQEGDFGLLRGHARVLVVRLHYLSLPVLSPNSLHIRLNIQNRTRNVAIDLLV
jgi:hypothetical protein